MSLTPISGTTRFVLTQKSLKLIALVEIEGFNDVEEFIRSAVGDSNCPGICMNEDCHYTTGVEPDQDEGWCEDCHTNTVKSGLKLAGLV